MADSRDNDMKYIMPLHGIAHFFGIFPLYNWRTDESNPAAKVKSYLIFLGMIMVYCWSVYGRKAYGFYDDKKPAVVFMEVLSNACLMGSYVLAFAELGITKTKHLKTLLATLDSIDAKFKKKTEATVFRLYCKVILVHLYVVVSSALTFVQLTGKYSKYVSWVYVCREVQSYFTCLLMLLAYNYILCMGVRFRRVNAEFGNAFLKGTFAVHGFTQIYLILLDTVDLFNVIFGWQILVLSVRLVVETLYLISTAVFLLSSQTLQKTATTLVIFTSKVALSWILVILLATSCNKAAKEVRKTIEISYKLMHDLRSIKSTPQSKRVHQELFLLAQKISVSSPHVSAAGFFPVDYTMLFTLIGCVTSYLIVLIQFNK